MTRLLLSPLVLVVVTLTVLGALLWRRDERLLASALGLVAISLYLCSAPFASKAAVSALAIAPHSECSSAPAGAWVIILTGGADRDVRSADEVHRLAGATFQRMTFGLNLGATAPGSTVVISGGARVGTTSEARIAERFATQMGWPADRLIVEDTSKNTWQSGQTVAADIPANVRPLLVTSMVHERRALLAYRKAGIAAAACPVPEDVTVHLPEDLIPQPLGLVKSTQVWKEALGLAIYSVRLTAPAATR